MSRYGVSLQDTYTASLVSIGFITRGASARARVYDFMIGSNGTPADNVITVAIFRHTTAPTSSAIVAEALDSADPAATTTAGENPTIEPSFGSESLMEFPLNQRATYRWVAAPGGELVIPDTADQGLALRANGPVAAGDGVTTTHWDE